MAPSPSPQPAVPGKGPPATRIAFLVSLAAFGILVGLGRLPPEELPRSPDWDLLLILGSFMLISQAARRAGIMDQIASLSVRAARGRALGLSLAVSSFALAALVTNDAALFTLIPLTAALARRAGLRFRRLAILEIMAVNLGSALTPWGNPQNLIIYRHYRLSPGQFFPESVLLAGVSLAVLAGLAWLASQATGDGSPDLSGARAAPGETFFLGISFALLVLGTTRLIPGYLAAAPLIAWELLRHPGDLRGVDWWLLGTIALLFPVMGQLGSALAGLISGETTSPLRVFLAGVGLSQLASNVPVTLLLAHATSDWRSLFWGVNLGGLGTLVSSFANLIGYSLYATYARQDGKGFLGEFVLWNALVLLAVGGVCLAILGARI